MSEQRNKDADMPIGPSDPDYYDDEEVAIITFCGEAAERVYEFIRVCTGKPADSYENVRGLGRSLGRSIIELGRVFNPQPPIDMDGS